MEPLQLRLDRHHWSTVEVSIESNQVEGGGVTLQDGLSGLPDREKSLTMRRRVEDASNLVPRSLVNEAKARSGQERKFNFKISHLDLNFLDCVEVSVTSLTHFVNERLGW